MSSPYVVLGNRSLDQWKVTELKEELKRRKLAIKGLKEDLVKRLDEAVRTELENAKGITDISLDEVCQTVLPPDQALTGSVVSEVAENPSVLVTGLDGNPETAMDDGEGLLDPRKVLDVDTGEEINMIGFEERKTAQSTIVDAGTDIVDATEVPASLSDSCRVNREVVTDVDPAGGRNHDRVEPHTENAAPESCDGDLQLHQPNASDVMLTPPTGLSLPHSEIQNELINSTVHLENDENKFVQPEHRVSPLKYQVSGVDHPDFESRVIFDSVSTETVSIIEINEVQVDVITDNINLELNDDRGMVHSPPSSFVEDIGDARSHNVQQSIEVSLTSNTENFDSLKSVDSDDFGPEKISLDRSSGDDSLEEDVLESKQMDYKSDSIQTMDRADKIDLLPVEEDTIIDIDGKPVTSSVAKDDNSVIATHVSVKRKFNGNEIERVGSNETSKRPHRWNIEGIKGSDAPSGTSNVPILRTPKNYFNDSEVTLGRLNRSVPGIDESPKERLVPPSSRPPSNSLRIDRFLRPFTLKAVQELLGKTGTVTSFWMDHIKTHCFVSYASVEEAIETRNAVYNLQWPPNGGRTLVAEFVEPDEVKAHANDVPLASSTTPSGSAAPYFSSAQITTQPQPSPRQQIQRKQPAPPSLPPPPPLASVPPHIPRELALPLPPPPLVEKIEPPIVTLDDLFRKTITTPRIYYLPLSDEQVAAKLGTNNQL